MEPKTVSLQRSTSEIPWGFRLAGGLQEASPLLITRITPGSPAANWLQKGDVLISLGGVDTTLLTYSDAMQIIQKNDNNMTIKILPNGEPTMNYPKHQRDRSFGADSVGSSVFSSECLSPSSSVINLLQTQNPMPMTAHSTQQPAFQRVNSFEARSPNNFSSVDPFKFNTVGGSEKRRNCSGLSNSSSYQNYIKQFYNSPQSTDSNSYNKLNRSMSTVIPQTLNDQPSPKPYQRHNSANNSNGPNSAIPDKLLSAFCSSSDKKPFTYTPDVGQLEKELQTSFINRRRTRSRVKSTESDDLSTPTSYRNFINTHSDFPRSVSRDRYPEPSTVQNCRRRTDTPSPCRRSVQPYLQKLVPPDSMEDFHTPSDTLKFPAQRERKVSTSSIVLSTTTQRPPRRHQVPNSCQPLHYSPKPVQDSPHYNPSSYPQHNPTNSLPTSHYNVPTATFNNSQSNTMSPPPAAFTYPQTNPSPSQYSYSTPSQQVNPGSAYNYPQSQNITSPPSVYPQSNPPPQNTPNLTPSVFNYPPTVQQPNPTSTYPQPIHQTNSPSTYNNYPQQANHAPVAQPTAYYTPVSLDKKFNSLPRTLSQPSTQQTNGGDPNDSFRVLQWLSNCPEMENSNAKDELRKKLSDININRTENIAQPNQVASPRQYNQTLPRPQQNNSAALPAQKFYQKFNAANADNQGQVSQGPSASLVRKVNSVDNIHAPAYHNIPLYAASDAGSVYNDNYSEDGNGNLDRQKSVRYKGGNIPSKTFQWLNSAVTPEQNGNGASETSSLSAMRRTSLGAMPSHQTLQNIRGRAERRRQIQRQNRPPDQMELIKATIRANQQKIGNPVAVSRQPLVQEKPDELSNNPKFLKRREKMEQADGDEEPEQLRDMTSERRIEELKKIQQNSQNGNGNWTGAQLEATHF